MKRILIFAAVILLLVAAGCKSNKTKIAILAPGSADFWKVVEAGANKAKDEVNIDVEVITPTESSAAEQKNRLEGLITKGVKGIALAPIDPKNQVDLINDISGKTKLVCMDTDAPGTNRICYIGSNNIEAGKLCGEELKKALPNGGKVYACVGVKEMQNAVDRVAGIREAIKGTKIVLVDILTDNIDNAKAKSNVENQVSSTPDVAAFIGIWSYNGPQIYNALKGMDKLNKIKIVCFDEDPQTLSGVREGVISATVVQDPFDFGYKSVKYLAALIRGENIEIPKDGIINTKLTVVDKKNVDEFEKDFNKKLGKKESK